MEAEQTDGQSIENALPPTIEQAESNNEQPAQETTDKAEKPLGYYPIDFKTASPEEIESRFNYVYKQVKDQKRTDQTLRQYREIAEQQAKEIENLTKGFTGVVNHLQDKTLTETESQLKQTMRAAYEAGDTDKYLAAQDKLDDLRLEKKLSARNTKEAPKPEVKTQSFDNGPGLPPEDQEVVDAWQDERDDSGKLLRPWAHNNSNNHDKPDSLYIAALNETFSVLRNPRFENYTMEQKMAEVDRRMGVKKSSPSQNVMGGGLTGNRKTSKLTLSPEAEKLAVRTKFGGPKAKSDAEHIEAYRKQLEKSTGARK